MTDMMNEAQNGVPANQDVLPANKVKVPPKPAAPDPILVNGVEIQAEAIKAEAQNHPADNPAQSISSAARALVVRELLIQEAAAKNILGTPEILGKGKIETNEDAATRALLESEIVTPSADEASCRRYYDNNLVKFVTATIYEARHILFAAPLSDAKARIKAKIDAANIIAELKNEPSKFAVLAHTHSACPSREQGGNLGQLTSGSTVEEFETVLMALEEGQLSPTPVPTQFGFHIIQLDRIIPGRQMNFEMVRGRIAAWLEAASWSRAVSQYIGILAGKADIQGIDMAATDTPLVQ